MSLSTPLKKLIKKKKKTHLVKNPPDSAGEAGEAGDVGLIPGREDPWSRKWPPPPVAE